MFIMVTSIPLYYVTGHVLSISRSYYIIRAGGNLYMIHSNIIVYCTATAHVAVLLLIGISLVA